jgi:hypothetical protein
MYNHLDYQLKVERTTACLEELKSSNNKTYYFNNQIDSTSLNNGNIESLNFDSFEKEYDEGNFLLEEYISLFEDKRCPMIEDLEIDYEKIHCPIDLTELYYEQILHKLDNDIWLLKSWISDFNETTIISFKKWFINNFNDEEEENNYNYYNWSIEFTQNLMRTSLDYVEENYSIHKSGGGSEYFFNKMEFLYCVAKASFEANLFELIEDDGGIFEDED